ncbi:MAG: head GIN domain-containing protein [Saprospiraceae bacterium]
MKKQVNFLVLGLLLVIGLSTTSCDVNYEGWCKDATGEQVEATYDLDEIDEISLSMNARVHLMKGDVQSVTVRGKEDAVDRLNYDVISGLWKIGFEDGECRDNHDIEIEITVTDLKALKVSGSGDIIVDNDTLVLDHELEMRISGSGAIFLLADVPSIDARISGSGDLELGGITQNLDINISGSGRVEAFDLAAENAGIKVSGSGRTEVFIDGGILDVDISGSGKVWYKGNPSSLIMDVSGSGEIIDAN